MTLDTSQHNAEDSPEALGERLQAFGSRLSKLAGEQAKSRAQIEQRWLEDIRQFHGEYTEDEKSRLQNSNGSEVFVNKTRNKAYGAEARTSDMLFPTDDRNWGIKPTPVPELTSQQASVDFKAVELDAKQCSERMQAEIDDQLNEGRYAIKSRDVIHDSIQCGTGVLKGPVIVGRARKRWKTYPNGVSELEIEEALEPSVERVDFWNFYPDMSARTIEECEFVFERHLWTKRQLRDFARLPDVIQPALKELVRGEADTQHITKNHIDDIRAITGVDTVNTKGKYEVWEYHGPIKKDELLDALIGAGSDQLSDDFEDLDDEVEAVVFFSSKHVLKVVINPLDTEDRPYSVFNWAKDESSIFGFGIPYLMRTAQKVINASYRMMMDNAGASVSDIIVANKQLIEPANGEWSSQPGKKKLYFLKDKTRSVQEAFASFTIPNHQALFERIFMLANQLADEETNMPLIAQGEQASHVTKTSSGMAMLMNSANIVLRGAIKNWDDDVTRPLITRFYDWNMQFSSKADIKGDMSVDARGSTVLLVREKQQENLMIYANVSAGNPELAMRRDWEGLDKEIAKSLEVPHDKLTLSDEEIAERQARMSEGQNKGDPAIELRKAELQMKQQELQAQFQLDQQRFAFEQQLAMQQLNQDRELKMADIASKQNITIEQLRAKTGLAQQAEKTKRDIAAVQANTKQTEVQLKAQNLAQGHDTYG